MRAKLTSPESSGPEGICAEILAYCYKYYPEMARPDILAALRAPKPEGVEYLSAEEAAAIRASMQPVDLKRGPGRPRKEVATLADAWPGSNEPSRE